MKLSALVDSTRRFVADELPVGQVVDELPVGQVVDEPAPRRPALSAVAPYAPAPFAQLARRCYRLRIDVPYGYAGGLLAGNLPYYKQKRRRAVHQQCPERRVKLWQWRLSRAYWYRTEGVMYWGTVA
jgi:hypothetical protein